MLKLDSQTRAIVMAIGGAAIAAVAAMLVPVALWETITGSTGISEMIPATRAPLGDTARAMIAFGFGALTFAVLATMLLRGKATPRPAAAAVAEPIVYETAVEIDEDEDENTAPSLIARLRERVSAFVEARRGGGEISGLEDLPKLRSGDAHPDAPPRRPLLATRDLADPVPEPEVVAEPVVEVQVPVAAPVIAEQAQPVETAEIAETAIAEPDAELSTASLAQMVDRLEVALTDRDGKLAQLEALVTEASAAKPQPLREVPSAAVEPEFVERAVAAPPVLEAVPAAPATPVAAQEPEEMDAALRSALETLHRMNARTR